MATLRFEIKGEAGSITVRGFLVEIENAFRMLAEYDSAISSEPTGSLDWVITNVSIGSLWIEAESRSRLEDRNVGPEVAKAYMAGWAQIEREGTTPPYLTEAGMLNARRIVKLIGREGIAGFAVSDLSERVEISAQASANIDQLIPVRYRSIGSIEGRLETISVHGRPKFVVYLSRTGKAVTCRIEGELLLATAKDALGRRVGASGTVLSNAKGEPLRVAVERIHTLRSAEELPTTASLAGSDPDFTGGLSTEEYVRSLRGA